jgi:hypothetical protein
MLQAAEERRVSMSLFPQIDLIPAINKIAWRISYTPGVIKAVKEARMGPREGGSMKTGVNHVCVGRLHERDSTGVHVRIPGDGTYCNSGRPIGSCL